MSKNKGSKTKQRRSQISNKTDASSEVAGAQDSGRGYARPIDLDQRSYCYISCS
jgi:hypothetical protein